MQRRTFIQHLATLTTMHTLSSFRTFTDQLEAQEKLMPVLFIGHGSPMNGIEDNAFSRRWEKM
ncbi:MAG TPA: 4,5-DOPA dioxygenase extradiol, partial [Ferruginibacter sp.]|nr:4,5-DOPA dioxygenase extradiol [Ferruginibacter sp.]